MRNLLDQTGQLWAKGALIGKVGSASPLRDAAWRPGDDDYFVSLHASAPWDDHCRRSVLVHWVDGHERDHRRLPLRGLDAGPPMVRGSLRPMSWRSENSRGGMVQNRVETCAALSEAAAFGVSPPPRITPPHPAPRPRAMDHLSINPSSRRGLFASVWFCCCGCLGFSRFGRARRGCARFPRGPCGAGLSVQKDVEAPRRP